MSDVTHDRLISLPDFACENSIMSGRKPLNTNEQQNSTQIREMSQQSKFQMSSEGNSCFGSELSN